MIKKVMIFMDDWGSTFYGVYYESGKTAIYDKFSDLPRTVKIYISRKSPQNPKYDKFERCTAFTYL